MQTTDDRALLRQYIENQSDAAFAGLVERHINLVYSVALRHVGNPHHAEEITQAVFIILARKARSLRHDKALSSWLFQATRLTAENFRRSESRRRNREQEAYMRSTLNEPDDQVWPSIAPLLDTAVASLGENDRRAILLRFYEGRSVREVGTALGASEEAAEKRVTRAVERLRKFFTKRGVTLTTAAIAGAVSANSTQAAPVGLAATVVAATAKGTLVSATIATAVKGTTKTLTWLKLKFAANVVMAVSLAGGLASMAVSTSKTEEAAPPTPTGEFPGLTIISMLTETPIVSDAVFVRELFMPGISGEARKQTYSFKIDGDNFVLTDKGISVGKYDGVWWYSHGHELTFFDPKINKNGEGAWVVETVRNLKFNINGLLNLGFSDMKPGSAEWTDDHRHFTAKRENGGTLKVDVSLENNLPALAEIQSNGIFGSIKYSYAPAFFNGKVPVEFSGYQGTSKAHQQKLFSIQLRTLAITDKHLPPELVDPSRIFKGSSISFYSNNIAYWIEPGGKVSRILTMDENKLEIERLKTKQLKR